MKTKFIALLILTGLNAAAQGTNCLQIQCPGNITMTSCVPTQVFYTPTVTDLCCTNGEVLVAGGANGHAQSLSSAELYDPATGTWTLTGSMAIGRDVPTATLLPDGPVLVAGGFNENTGAFLSSAELYNPITGLWTSTGSMNVARQTQGATLLNNGLVLVAGGEGVAGSLTSAELYNPASGTWTVTGTMASARAVATLTLLPNGKALVAGGADLANSTAVSTAEIYDPATGAWTQTGSLFVGRYAHTATLLPNGKVLVAGGINPTSNPVTISSAEIYDPATGTWTVTGSMNSPRESQSAVLLPSGKVLVAAGSGPTSCELYDPATGTWTFTGSMPAAGAGEGGLLLPNGLVIVEGGATSVVIPTTQLYNPAVGTWTLSGSLNIARVYHTATLLQNWQVSCTPPSGSYFVPGTTNTITCVATDNCGNSNSCSFTVTVLAGANCDTCCGPGLGPQTIHWLPFPTNGTVLSDPLGTNPQGSWWLTNLPCYGRVLVTQNFPDSVSWSLNPNLANVPNGNGIFDFTAPGYGPYSWGTSVFMAFFASNVDSYNVTFYFLDGPPNPCDLALGVAGLAAGTTANASQPLTFRTEYDLNSPLTDGTSSAFTKLGTVYGPPIAGSTGTLVGSAFNQDSIGDSLNTGWAVLQPVNSLATTNLAAGTVQGFGALNNLSYLSLHVTQQAGDGIGFSMGYICCSNCLQVQAASNILIYSCTNVPVVYPQLVVTDPCCGTNWSVVFDPPSGISFAPGTGNLVNWYVYDCYGTNIASSGSFWVSVLCTNCCEGPLTNYTVSVFTGSNYLADALCQGTSNTLADVLPSVPQGTEVYFWNPAAGQFTPPDTFTSAGWQNGTEPLFPGEGFLLVSFTNQYPLTIYGDQPGCPGNCSSLNCSSDTLLVGDYGLNPNPVPFCNLFCCPPISGTKVQVWDATSQSFATYTYGTSWSPSQGPPPLPVGYSEFVGMDTSLPVINCPGDIVTNSCTNVAVFFTVTASNAFGGMLNATADPPSGSKFIVGTTTVNCAVTNACGRTNACSFTVTVVCPTNGVAIQTTRSGNTFTLTWPAGQGGTLQVQTNGLSSTNWATVTGAADGSYTITVDPATPAMFFRLKYP